MSTFTIARYLRISAEDQDIKQSGKSESNSIANQRNLLEDFIRRMPEFKDAAILEFCDDGWSGKNFERPAVRKMLEMVKQGKIQCIIVKDLSRFGRDYLIVGNYLSRVFPFLGVRFIAVNDGFDSIRQSDIDSLETSFKTLLYDLYSRDLSRKVRFAKQFRAQKGDFMSPFAPYGYRKDPDNQKRLAIDSEAAKIVRRIFHMAAEGQGTMQIARIMNREHILTPMMYKRAAGCSRTLWPCVHEDNFWTNATVIKILRDERYLGKTIYGKRMRDEVGKNHSVKKSREQWIIVEDVHEGIVTQEEFDQAQAQLRMVREWEADTSGRKAGLLDKKVYCGICGHTMQRRNKKEPYFVCHTSYFTDAYSCTREQIQEKELMEVVLTSLQMQAKYAVEISRIWQEQNCQREKESSTMVQTLSEWKEIVIGLERDIQELYEKFVFGEMDKTAYQKTKEKLTKKREDIAAKTQELEVKLHHIGADGKLENQFVNCFQQYTKVEELTTQIVAEVLERIEVYPDKRLEIIWNYQEDLELLLRDVGVKENLDTDL